jgi:phosphodiesterase/alkaline phosphatase D-like protein
VVISWDTDESATSKIWYGTETPLVLETSTEDTSTTTSHSLEVAGLTASTTYYYVVEAADEAGNIATSSELSFTTLAEVEPEPEPDTTAPVISEVSSASATSTVSTITWTTDEPATSKVWFGTTTPLTLANPTGFVENLSTTTSHSLDIAGLTASTTYYYVTESADEADNTANSEELTFTIL